MLYGTAAAADGATASWQTPLLLLLTIAIPELTLLKPTTAAATVTIAAAAVLLRRNRPRSGSAEGEAP
jgi:hypothetical protein